MSDSHDVNVDIVATDDASKVVDDVATKVEGLDGTTATVDVAADTAGATRAVGDLGADLDTVAKDRRITLEARADALRGDLKTVQSELDALDRETVTVDVDADTKKAKGKLGDLSTAAGKAGGEGGTKFGEQFIRDVGGLFGGSDALNMFADLAAGAETGGEGVAASFVGPILTALSIGGVAFVAVKKFWDLWHAESKKAKEEADQVVAAIASGDIAKASQQIVDSYGKQIDAAARFGLTTQQVVQFITGASSSLGDLTAELDATGPAYDRAQTLTTKHKDMTIQQALALVNLVDDLKTARGAYQDSNTTLGAAQQKQFDVTKALGATNDALLSQARTAIPAVKDEILKYIAVQNGIPESKITTILTDTNPDDVAQVQQTLDELAADRTATVKVDMDDKAFRDKLQRLNELPIGMKILPSASRGAQTAADLAAYKRVGGRVS